MTLLILYVAGALAFSFLCSLLEASLLSASIPDLLRRKEAGERKAAVMLDLRQNRVDDALSVILTVNTVAHTVGATLAGAQAAHVLGSHLLGVFSAVLTIAILVLTEIIPKTIGTAYANRLTGFTSTVLQALVIGLKPIVVATRALTGLFARKVKPSISRDEIAALVTLAAREGALRTDQGRVFANLLRLDEVRVMHAMTPRTVMVALPATATIEDLLTTMRGKTFSRIPLFEGNRDQIVGYVLLRDALEHAARTGERDTPLSTLKREARFVPYSAALLKILPDFLTHRGQLAMVVDEYGGVSGLITLEDLLETILGAEIVDEYDRIVDLQAHAIELRDRRLARHALLGANTGEGAPASVPDAHRAGDKPKDASETGSEVGAAAPAEAPPAP